MIRRREQDAFWLIRQDEHARLSGELARHVGNERFAPLSAQAVEGIALHDAGWPLHDDAPTLTPGGLPLDVFESTRNISLRVWLESARRAAKVGPYQGLLTSLHQLSLSAISVSSNPPARFDNQQLRQQFDLNKFQHAVIEHLEKLRAKAGLTTSKPLRLGLADGWSDSREEELKFDFKYLQVMDQLSLGICCTIPPHATSFAFFERPGGETVQLEIQRPDPGTLKVAPWPFDREKIVVEYGYKSVPARPFSNPQEWTEVYSAAPSLSQRVEVVPI